MLAAVSAVWFVLVLLGGLKNGPSRITTPFQGWLAHALALQKLTLTLIVN